jgi:hypothetical protein
MGNWARVLLFHEFQFKSPERDIVAGRKCTFGPYALVGRRGKIRLVGVLFELLQAAVSTRDPSRIERRKKIPRRSFFFFHGRERPDCWCATLPRKLDD